MDLKTGTLLVPPTVKNSSCSHPRYTTHNLIIHIGIAETIEALLILILTLGVIGANALVIFVINNRRYSPLIHQQPRYLITSLALNDLTIGLLITPFGFLPALLHCWPYGEIFCQIQALLRGALSQQSAVILVCMAVDRYMCALHPRRYYQHSSKKGCVAILSLTWIISLTAFAFLVLPKGYYFNNTGLMACEPFYSKPSYRILATCALYFPTTMVLMYCYGSSFHMSRFRLNDPTMPTTNPHHPLTSSATTPVMNLSMAMSMGLTMNSAGNTITKKIVPIQEKQSNGSTSRSMAAISLAFIVMVTPWTIQEIVTACTGSKLPPFLDFIVTWTALSNSFWNPFLYWLLNSQFRRLSRHLLPNRCFPTEDTPEHKSQCCRINSECDITTLPMPPEPPTSRPPLSRSASQNIYHGHLHHQHSGQSYGSVRPDIEGLSEKYWGEILERTVSSGSLHALQKSFTSPHQYHQYHHQHLHHQQQQQQQQQQQKQQQQQQHQQQQQKHQQHQYTHHSHPHAMTTSFSKNSDLNLTILENEHENCSLDGVDDVDGNSGCVRGGDSNNFNIDRGGLLNKFSTSEPKLCEHIYHDANCAKNKALAVFGAGGGGNAGTTTNSVTHHPTPNTTVSAAFAASSQKQHSFDSHGIGRSIPDI